LCYYRAAEKGTGLVRHVHLILISNRPWDKIDTAIDGIERQIEKIGIENFRKKCREKKKGGGFSLSLFNNS
jgi:hypothetical protein